VTAPVAHGPVTIGEAAAASGVSAKMIRYYEAVGLIPPAGRTQAGYRTYAAADVHTLRFVRRARDLGFGVDEIAALLALWRDRSRASADVRQVAVDHIGQLRQRIAELQAMVRTLEHLAHHCHGDDRPDCPILDDLAQTATPRHPKPANRFAPGQRRAHQETPE